MTQCNSNFLAPNGFQLDIPGFSSVGFQVISANIPGISMGGPQQATPLNDFQLSGDKLEYESLTVRFLVDEDCTNYSFIHNWMVGITYPQQEGSWHKFAQAMRDRNFQDDSLDSIDMKTMQSKVCKNIYFTGEVMDIDGITGGYNFQAAWTTAFIAAKLK